MVLFSWGEGQTRIKDQGNSQRLVNLRHPTPTYIASESKALHWRVLDDLDTEALLQVLFTIRDYSLLCLFVPRAYHDLRNRFPINNTIENIIYRR